MATPAEAAPANTTAPVQAETALASAVAPADAPAAPPPAAASTEEPAAATEDKKQGDEKQHDDAREHEAAAKIQALQRGRIERADPHSKSNLARTDRKSLEETTAETEALVKQHRATVNEHADNMRKLFDESKQAHAAGDGARAKELSDQAKVEQKLMKDASMAAARAIFVGKNADQPQGCIDLHGQQVAECIIIVEEQLTAAQAAGWPTLKIITGAGHHSGPGGVKIKPAVHDLLKKGSYSWAEDTDNASGGSLTVTF